ncbi:hypothetical protein [Dokdonia sp. Hel_I_53]|uniref:hypothetical protein n=1 Tax=Dokdonia sp. Hel_I_53 TaxID=1566287 RepID=UPI00119C6F4A|nr:hypothetical protein [Dokdonia sp. Hel_I_53]TVZ52259.1 hypothetical protein OD90_1429 [Dokdonia sp. Hel_I_53]
MLNLKQQYIDFLKLVRSGSSISEKKLTDSFLHLIEISDSNLQYFPLCSFKTYLSTYDDRLRKFQNEHYDAIEIDFIEFEEEQTEFFDFPDAPFFYKYAVYSERRKEEFRNKRKHEFVATYDLGVINDSSKTISNLFLLKILERTKILSSMVNRGYTYEKIAEIFGIILGRGSESIRQKMTKLHNPISNKQQDKINKIFTDLEI